MTAEIPAVIGGTIADMRAANSLRASMMSLASSSLSISLETSITNARATIAPERVEEEMIENINNLKRLGETE